MAWGRTLRDLIKNAEVPRALLKEFSEQATPRTLLRSTTLSLAATLDKAAAAQPNEAAPRQLLVGPRGSGKSHLLLQSVAYALDEGWAVAYVPRCISLIDSTSPFVYTPAQQVYAQPVLAQHLARSLAAQKCIADLPLLQEPADEAGVEASPASKTQRELAVLAKTCGELARAAAAETVAPAIRVAAIELLLRSLAAQTQVPFLLAIDDVQALYMRSAYRDADYAPLEAWELSLPRSILHLLRSNGPQRGAVLAATGESATEWKASPAFRQAIGDTEPGHSKRTVPLNAYTPIDQTHLKHALEARWHKVEVPKLTQAEAKGLWEVMRMEGGHWSSELLLPFSKLHHHSLTSLANTQTQTMSCTSSSSSSRAETSRSSSAA